MTLADLVAEFAETTNGHDPERTRGECRNESDRFVYWLQREGIEADLIDGFEFKTMREILLEEGLSPEEIEARRDEMDLDHPMITHGHVAVQVGDEVYDWTARQFPPHDQPVPLVQSVSEWRKTWRWTRL